MEEEGGGERGGEGWERGIDRLDKRVVSSCTLYLYPACASSSASILNSSYIFLQEIKHDWCVMCVCVCVWRGGGIPHSPVEVCSEEERPEPEECVHLL